MANTKQTNTRSGAKSNNKENGKGGRPSIGENNKQQKDTAEVKRKYEELNKTVESLRGQIASLEKKQLTESVVKSWLRAAMVTQTHAVTVPIPAGQGTGGYLGLQQLVADPRSKLMLIL